MSVRIFNYYIHLPVVILALLDALIFFGSVYLAAFLWLDGSIAHIQEIHGSLFPRALLFTVAMILAVIAMGLYRARQRFMLAGSLVRLFTSVWLAGAFTMMAYYLVPDLYLGRGHTAMTMIIAFAGAGLTRSLFYRFIDENLFKRRVLVYGAGKRADNITQLRRRSDQRGFVIVGFVRADGDKPVIDDAKVVHISGPLIEYSRAHDIDEIVVAMDDRRRSFPVQELLEAKLSGVDVVDLLTFFERETGKVKLDVLNPSWMIFAEGFRRSALREALSRAFDILAALGLLLLTWPIMLMVVIAIMGDKGFGHPILYRQARVGYEGEVFELLKFRSMSVDAEKEGEAIWAQQNDSRITRVGQIIRKFRLDELPQLMNVLRGHMSFVGPRPERPEFVTHLNEKIPYYRERHYVKPGITGWAQLCYPYGSSEQDAMEKLQYDLYYVKNHSMLFDVMILLQTAEVILWGKGAR